MADDEQHCQQGYDDEYERTTACTDVDAGGCCYHCECCCECMACLYGPRDGVGMTDAQRAPAAAIAEATS